MPVFWAEVEKKQRIFHDKNSSFHICYNFWYFIYTKTEFIKFVWKVKCFRGSKLNLRTYLCSLVACLLSWLVVVVRLIEGMCLMSRRRFIFFFLCAISFYASHLTMMGVGSKMNTDLFQLQERTKFHSIFLIYKYVW